MTDTLDPKDLARFQSAQRGVVEAQKRAIEANRAFEHAVGAAQFVNQDIAQAYALQMGDTMDPKTGVITRKAPVLDGDLPGRPDSVSKETVAGWQRQTVEARKRAGKR